MDFVIDHQFPWVIEQCVGRCAHRRLVVGADGNGTEPTLSFQEDDIPVIDGRQGAEMSDPLLSDGARRREDQCAGRYCRGRRNPDGQGFAVFGRVVRGMDVARAIQSSPANDQILSPPIRILRAYRTKYQGKSAVTAELQAVADSIVGSSMAWFFNQWIYGRGWPKYALRYSWLADTLSLTVQQQQDPSWPTFRMPMRIRAYHGAQHTDFLVWDSLRVQSFRFPLSVPPDSVVLDPDGWILKQVVPFTSVAELNNSPYEFRLYQNYPNPFNPTTVIPFSVESANGRMGDPVKVTLKVYDILGRDVRTLVNENLPGGRYDVTWDAANMPSGVYFYRMTAGTFVQTRCMMLVR